MFSDPSGTVSDAPPSGPAVEFFNSDTFLIRLQILRRKLAPLMDKLEFFHTTPGGIHTTPEIDSHRSYAQGEDIRSIDWNLYARFDRFFLKTVVTEEEGILHVVLDSSASMIDPHPSKQRNSLEISAGIAYLILASGNKLAVHFCAEKLLQSRRFYGGEKETPLLMHHLSSMASGGQTNLGASLDGLLRTSLGTSNRVIIITDLLDTNGYLHQLDRFKEQGIRAGVIQLLHPREIFPVFKGNLMLIDPETGERQNQTIGFKKLKALRNRIQLHLMDTERQFQTRGIPFLRASSRDPFEETVLKFMTLPGWRGRS